MEWRREAFLLAILGQYPAQIPAIRESFPKIRLLDPYSKRCKILVDKSLLWWRSQKMTRI